MVCERTRTTSEKSWRRIFAKIILLCRFVVESVVESSTQQNNFFWLERRKKIFILSTTTTKSYRNFKYALYFYVGVENRKRMEKKNYFPLFDVLTMSFQGFPLKRKFSFLFFSCGINVINIIRISVGFPRYIARNFWGNSMRCSFCHSALDISFRYLTIHIVFTQR